MENWRRRYYLLAVRAMVMFDILDWCAEEKNIIIRDISGGQSEWFIPVEIAGSTSFSGQRPKELVIEVLEESTGSLVVPRVDEWSKRLLVAASAMGMLGHRWTNEAS